MLVLVSFVLVLAAAVTLVVGLLQSGLTLIYLSIACSVLAGVVLAVAVLRGRPEPKPAAGRSFAPPPRPEPAQVPASVGAPSSGAATTGTWSAPPSPPPPPPSSSGPAGGDDAATKAAGTALLGRLRGRKGEPEPPAPPPEPEVTVEPAVAVSDQTTEMAAVGTPTEPTEPGEDFPIADFDRLRATEVLAQLPSLDRNQLEAVRQREASGKNRFTVMNRIDALLASKAEPAWEVDEDEWEPGAGTDAESEAALIEAEAIRVEDDFGAAGEVEDDEVDELVSPAQDFPIAGYDSLTVGQILPRLSELTADELAQVRARELQGRGRGTILDRVDRLATKAGAGTGALAMPPAPARKATGRKAPARKAAAASKATVPVRKTTRAAKAAPPAAPAPAPAPAPKRAPARKAATKAAPAPRKATASRKAAAPAPVPVKEAAKRARATKRTTKST